MLSENYDYNWLRWNFRTKKGLKSFDNIIHEKNSKDMTRQDKEGLDKTKQ